MCLWTNIKYISAKLVKNRWSENQPWFFSEKIHVLVWFLNFLFRFVLVDRPWNEFFKAILPCFYRARPCPKIALHRVRRIDAYQNLVFLSQNSEFHFSKQACKRKFFEPPRDERKYVKNRWEKMEWVKRRSLWSSERIKKMRVAYLFFIPFFNSKLFRLLRLKFI